jgi:uncharacterized protein
MLIEKNIFENQPLIVAMVVGVTAQIIKVLISYTRNRTWNWALLLRAGGMPSSHAAMVAGVAHSIGLNVGFGSPTFAVAFVLAIVVTYDATGIRRQAGKHAEVINQMVRELASGHPLQQEQLREVLGHTPFEAFVGMVLGVLFAQIIWLLWH